MKTLGVIVEYNPFHNGHHYHLQQAKKIAEADTTIAVMSGPFLQRGEPALVSKWVRTKMALLQGIDIVVEIPFIYATQAADWFAFGSTSLLNYLKVDHFVFGSESNALATLDQIAEILLEEPPLLKEYIKNELSIGQAYPKALSNAINRYFTKEEFKLATPNDILGVQYIHNLKKLNSKIKINTVKRTSAQYHDKEITHKTIASATAIRKTIFTNKNLDDIMNVVPISTLKLLQNEYKQYRINSWDNYFQALKIITNGKTILELKEIHGMVEGFEQRLKDQFYQSTSFDELIFKLKTKRYTLTKIQRTLLYLLLNLTKTKVNEIIPQNGPQYIRVLGFNERGRNYLNKIKKDLAIPLITNIKRNKLPMLELDIAASMAYELGFNNQAIPDIEYRQSPIYIGETTK